MEPESPFATPSTPRPRPSVGLERPRPAPVSPELVDREVSCRVLGVFFDAARERGLPPEALIEGTDRPLAHFTNPRERIPWAAFDVFLRNVGKYWTEEEIEAMGRRVMASPLLRALLVIGRLLYSVTDFYLWAFAPDGPALVFFAAETGTASEVAPGLVRLQVDMRPGYAPLPLNYVVAKGALRGIAEAFGYGPADVIYDRTPTGAVFHVRVPIAGGRLAWLRRWFTWILAARTAGRELRQAHADLHERYLELQREIEARNAAELARQQLEADREELLTRLQLILDGMPLGCLVFDATGRLGYANPAAERIFGRMETWQGKRPFELFAEGPARAEIAAAFERLLVGLPVAPTVSDNVALDGARRRCEWHHTPLVHPDGAFAGVVSVCEDVTDRERTVAQLLQAQKMEGIGRLAGGIAHDFNNLLSVVMGYASVLEEEVTALPKALAATEQIQRAAERGASLSRQLLAFSRQQVLDPRVLDLSEVVEASARMLQPLLGEDVEVVVLRAPDPVRVTADATQLEQVVVNLAVNARDAMPQGGRLTIETAIVDIDEAWARTVPDAQAGPHVRLSVSDTGTGMDEETRARVFEPFFTTKPVGRGTGLGLSMVYGVVRQSGGHVTVRSEPGRGTVFHLYLPRVDAPAKPQPESPPVASRGSERILVVEDDLGVRTLAVEVLERLGYRATAASSPAEALRILHEGPIDLLLTDVIMPGMTGVDLARRVAVTHPRVRVLYISGYAPTGVLDSALDTADFLPKPFTPSVLGLKVRALLDR